MIDRQDPKPLHLQIEEYIRERLDTGEWVVNQMIPSENEFSKNYGISRMTVRNAITKLVYDGLLYRVPGKGTFVNEPRIVASSYSYTGFRKHLEDFGSHISTKVIGCKMCETSVSIAARFDLPENFKFHVIEKVRYNRQVPLSLHVTYIPEHLAYALEVSDLENERLDQVLREKFKLSHSKVVETIESIASNERESKLLAVPFNHPLIQLEDFMFMGDIPYEFSRIVFRGDKIKLRFEFE